MLNRNNIVVFDFETGSLDTATLEPIQIAAAVIDPRSLQVTDTFESLIKPLDFGNLQAGALAVNKKTKAQLEKAPDRKSVWDRFVSFVKARNVKGGITGLPIAAGKNIRLFDLPIADRLCRDYGWTDKNGEALLFHRRIRLDLEDVLFWWFENCEEPAKYTMDACREFFGLSKEGAHDALVDVLQTADLLTRFLRLHRELVSRRKKDGSPFIDFRGGVGK